MENRNQIEFVIASLSDEEIEKLAMFTLEKNEVKANDVFTTYIALKAKYVNERARVKKEVSDKREDEERLMRRIDREREERIFGNRSF